MKRHFLVIIGLLLTLTTLAQNKMRPIAELINTNEPGWPIVKDWIKSAKNSIEILTSDSSSAKDALVRTQVTTRSPMGAIIYMTGGILIDSGWIRILGSGNPKLTRTLPGWNKGKSFKEFGDASPYLLIADDVIGGFFMLNGGGLGKDVGKVYYFSPDNLTYEALDLSYSDFLNFCFNGDLDKFYKGSRWTGWKKDLSQLDGDKAFSFYPYLWSKEGKDINKNTKMAIPIEEIYNLNIRTRKELGIGQ